MSLRNKSLPRALVFVALLPALGQASASTPSASREVAREAGAARREPSRLLCLQRRTIWQRVQTPRVDAYCTAVATAQASVWSAPDRASSAASRAARIQPEGLEAALVLALVELSARRPEEATRSFQRALLSPDRNLVPVPFLAAAARAALLAGDYRAASELYRRLALVIDQIPGSRERSRALLEASLAVAFAEEQGLDEARAFARQAAYHFAPMLESVRQGVLLAISDLAGPPLLSPEEGERAYDALAWIFERSRPAYGAPLEVLPVLPPGGRELLLGVMASTFDEALAREHLSGLLDLEAGVPPHLKALAERSGAVPAPSEGE